MHGHTYIKEFLFCDVVSTEGNTESIHKMTDELLTVLLFQMYSAGKVKWSLKMFGGGVVSLGAKKWFFLGSFAKLRKATDRFVASVCPSLRSH